MSEPTAGGVDLVAIDLAGEAAAGAIRACWDSGDAVLVVDPTLPEAAKSALMWQVRPTAIIGEHGRKPLRGIPAPPGTAAVVMTSGTGAAPKAVTLTRAGMEAMATAYSAAIGVSESDRWLVALPLNGVAGLAIIARSYVTGIQAVVHDRYRADAVAGAAAQREASVVSLVPTVLRRLVDAQAPIDRFRVILIGGAPLPDDLRARAEAAGATIVTTYGMTETWGGFALDGHPLAGARIRLAADDEIEVAGPMVMSGYRLDAEATEDILHGGWLSTGDLGSWDGELLTVTGRKADRIISGGVTVSPAAVERILIMDPAIADVAVAGAADDEWGERVVAHVVPVNPAEPPSLDHVRNLVKEHLTPASAPRELRLTGRIPRNAAGKILRRELGR